MKVRIFETDPNAAPKKRMTFPDDANVLVMSSLNIY